MRLYLLIPLILVFLGVVMGAEVGVSPDLPRQVTLILPFEVQEFKLEDLTARVETENVADTYSRAWTLRVENGKVFVTIEVSDIFEDYPITSVDSLIIEGRLNGELFAKRITVHGQQKIIARAPEQSEQFSILLAIVIIVLLVILLFLSKRQQSKKEQILKRKRTVKRRSRRR